jgi:hypothetical protein
MQTVLVVYATRASYVVSCSSFPVVDRVQKKATVVVCMVAPSSRSKSLPVGCLEIALAIITCHGQPPVLPADDEGMASRSQQYPLETSQLLVTCGSLTIGLR